MTHDTLPDVEAMQRAAMRRLSPVARLRLAFDMSEMARSLAAVRVMASPVRIDHAGMPVALPDSARPPA